MNKVFTQRKITSDWTFFVVAEVADDVTIYTGFIANEQQNHAVPLKIVWEASEASLEESSAEQVHDHFTELMLSTFLDDILYGLAKITENPWAEIDALYHEAQDYYRFQESVKELIED